MKQRFSVRGDLRPRIEPDWRHCSAFPCQPGGTTRVMGQSACRRDRVWRLAYEWQTPLDSPVPIERAGASNGQTVHLAKIACGLLKASQRAIPSYATRTSTARVDRGKPPRACAAAFSSCKPRTREANLSAWRGPTMVDSGIKDFVLRTSRRPGVSCQIPFVYLLLHGCVPADNVLLSRL